MAKIRTLRALILPDPRKPGADGKAKIGRRSVGAGQVVEVNEKVATELRRRGHAEVVDVEGVSAAPPQSLAGKVKNTRQSATAASNEVR